MATRDWLAEQKARDRERKRLQTWEQLRRLLAELMAQTPTMVGDWTTIYVNRRLWESCHAALEVAKEE